MKVKCDIRREYDTHNVDDTRLADDILHECDTRCEYNWSTLQLAMVYKYTA